MIITGNMDTDAGVAGAAADRRFVAGSAVGGRHGYGDLAFVYGFFSVREFRFDGIDSDAAQQAITQNLERLLRHRACREKKIDVCRRNFLAVIVGAAIRTV